MKITPKVGVVLYRNSFNMIFKKNASPALSGRHVPAQGAAANNNPPRVAKIDVLRKTDNGLIVIAKYSCEYYSKIGLFQHIHDYFGADELRITLANGLWFFWNFCLAHYCFDHGSMTEDDFILSTIESLGKDLDFNEKHMRRAAVCPIQKGV
jgi:hypothetical protein